MARQCFYTGKKARKGNRVQTRGKKKYLGGVGTKITGITRRKFKPNLQTVRAVVDGQVKRITVSTQAIRMGLVEKPVVNKPFVVKETAE
ncbi:MAG: 50S ribosomal protein L28 [Planctomycetota bacterium]